MTKYFKIGDKSFFVLKETVVASIVKDTIFLGLAFLLAFLNYNYIGNSWYIGLFIVIILLFWMVGKASMRNLITKKEFLKEMEEQKWM